ncbi:copper resistance D family protein [Paenibacillus protaetiae]|uniref:Copper resistance protein D domain-containing protein n=1 Tax=Paenibacillus protaetiae TaxID=2509456 RepID=A0A4P6EX73_9BACL|nr:CopD family protein [Paenibacillus protaetiae]QAY65197.1 hypothetical protein ET464_01150 [Paenibacillus protaetiae]
MIYVSEALLYVCFALLMGTFVLRIVPEHRRPDIHVHNGLLFAAAIAVPILSYAPIHKTAVLFSKDFDMSYFTILKQILTEINSGKAWLWTLIGSAGLAVLLALKSFRNDKHMPKVGLFITFLLVIWLGYGSHSASIEGTKGIVVHTAHFLAVTVWIGILFVAGWFARSSQNWDSFLRWFSPVAIICVLLAIAAGILLMTFTAPQYLDSWMLPYGQMLLIKHLLIVPLLVFAYTNGVAYRSKIKKDKQFNPRPWLKAESVVALLVFIATGILGQQTPPHNVQQTLQSVSPSPWFSGLYKGHFSPDIQLHLSLHPEALLLFAAAAVMIAGMAAMYRSNRLIPAFAMGILVSVFGYFGLMFAIA